jgi:hypothetical protein
LKNNSAGNSQRFIAAVSIGTIPQLAGLAVPSVCSSDRMPGYFGQGYPEAHGAVVALPSDLTKR